MMHNRHLRLLLVSGLMAVLVTAGLQYFWLNRALARERYVRDQKIYQALSQAAKEVQSLEGAFVPSAVPIEQLSDDYFVVHVNAFLNDKLLEHYLSENLRGQSIHEDFEYGIYDCLSDRMIYGGYVPMNTQAVSNPAEGQLATVPGLTYYFGVRFPARVGTLGSLPEVMVGGLVVLLAVFVFFGISIWSAYRQRSLRERQRDFINSLAHNFNTPLTTIGLTAEYLERHAASAEQRRYAQTLGAEQKRLSGQLAKFLSLGRVEMMKAERVKINLASFVQKLLDYYQPLFDSQDQLQMLLDHPWEVNADETLLKESLVAIFDNALKYVPSPRHLQISARLEGAFTVLSIQDNGPGFAQIELKSIGRRYYRGSKRGDGTGFGLGLYSAKKALKAMAGELKISTSHEGAMFELYLRTWQQ